MNDVKARLAQAEAALRALPHVDPTIAVDERLQLDLALADVVLALVDLELAAPASRDVARVRALAALGRLASAADPKVWRSRL